jgi:hypothetical protein
MVRKFLGGDLVVSREEIWRPAGTNAFHGTVRATIPGVPGEITGETKLADDGAGGSEWLTVAQIRVGIPLVGAKAEVMIAEQLRRLLASETDFTSKWLADQGA